MKKIIWAVDAFQPKNKIKKNCAHALSALTKGRKATIEPVYMLSDGLLGLSVPVQSLDRNFRPAAEKALRTAVSHARLRALGKPKVITRMLSSTTDAVVALDRYARSRDADLIVVGSHARTGLPRMILGSFAETLLLHTKTPVLTVGPKIPKKPHFEHILFATDFSKNSERMFDRVVRLARELRSKITIFHAIPNPADPVVQSGVFLLGGGWMPVTMHLGELEEDRGKTAASWVAAARKGGVKADFKIESWSLSASDSILSAARKTRCGLIAMAAQSGPAAAILLGSATRQVLRHAQCPVWVMRG